MLETGVQTHVHCTTIIDMDESCVPQADEKGYSAHSKDDDLAPCMFLL
jgi:hypothetical protein